MSVSENQEIPCPTGYDFEFQGSLYKLDTIPTNNRNGLTKCETDGSSMAVLETEAELEHIRDMWSDIAAMGEQNW